jgi:hypothetical protein
MARGSIRPATRSRLAVSMEIGVYLVVSLAATKRFSSPQVTQIGF